MKQLFLGLIAAVAGTRSHRMEFYDFTESRFLLEHISAFTPFCHPLGHQLLDHYHGVFSRQEQGFMLRFQIREVLCGGYFVCLGLCLGLAVGANYLQVNAT